MPEQKILADEHISRTVVSRLNSYGIDALHVNDAGLRGKSDSELAEYALKENRIIVTMDDDFKQIATEEEVGVLFFTKRLNKRKMAEEIMKAMNTMTMNQLKGELVYLPWQK